MTHVTPSLGRQHFIQHAPKRPRAADEYSRGVQSMSKRAALDCAHMQLQPSEMRASIALDMDSPESHAVLREMDYPQPNLIMLNPTNGHAHPIWQFTAAIPFGVHARLAPQKAFLDLQKQMNILYGGDPAYAHYMVKTPGHTRWYTVETGAPRYSLTELLDAMPAGIAKQSRTRGGQKLIGEGRHDTLWEIGRQWAYRHARQAKRSGTAETWRARVIAEFLNLNSFAQPLSINQVSSLARNVARWTWERADTLSGAVLDGQKRSHQKSWEREVITPEQARARQVQGAMYTNAIQRNRMHDRITGAIGELAGQGVSKPTQRQISQAAGVSLSSVEAWVRAGKRQLHNGN